MAILVLATLSPFTLRPPSGSLPHLLSAALHPHLVPSDVVDAVRNVVLFAGWGLLWALSERRRGSRRGRTVLAAVLTGAALSIALELAQLFVPTRTTSILDVLTNTSGSALGALAALGLVAGARLQRRRRSFLGVPASHLAGAYGAAVAFETAFPLLRSGTPGAYGGPLGRLAWSLRHLDPSTLLHLPLLDGLLFLPAGFLAVAALVEAGLGYREGARWAAAGGAVLAVAGEAVHLVLAQPVVLGAILVHAGAVAAGAWLAARALPPLTRRWRGASRAAQFLAAYAGLLALWTWRPFDIALPGAGEPLSWRRLLPMASLGVRSDLYSVSDVAIAFLAFVPVGSLLSAWPLRRRGLLSGVLPALWLALGLEAGQLLVASRFVDATDALVTFAGAAVAWAVMREAGYPVRGTLLGGRDGGGGKPG